MASMSQHQRAALFVFGAIALLLGLCVTVVPETSQAVVIRMGQPVRVINRWQADGKSGGGGLIAHLPFVEQVTWIDRGLVSFTAERQQIRGADEFPVLADIAATYRVFDPVKLVNQVGDTDKATDQLRSVMGALAQQELGRVPSGALIRPGNGGAFATLRTALDAKARPLGIQVVDVRLTGAALPEGELQQAYERMETERARQAIAETDTGAREAERISTEAQANAARILGNAAGQDPAFYDFYRAMLSYELVFANPANKGSTTIILGPDSEYLKQFKGK
ncbi:MAG: protease modulator HflC [Sphingomonadales bacterium]|nr:protease modulator HflC [Sphingomonadales bacterium]